MLSEMEKGVWLLSHIVVLCRLEARQTKPFCLSPGPLALMCAVSASRFIWGCWNILQNIIFLKPTGKHTKGSRASVSHVSWEFGEGIWKWKHPSNGFWMIDGFVVSLCNESQISLPACLVERIVHPKTWIVWHLLRIYFVHDFSETQNRIFVEYQICSFSHSNAPELSKLKK